MQTLVKEVIPNRFGHLGKYFGEMILTDLAAISEDDIVSLAEPVDRVQMRVLVNAILWEYTDRRDELMPEPLPIPAESKATIEIQGGVLNLRGMVLPAQLARVFPEKFTLGKELAQKILANGNAPSIQVVDLSRNHLLDEDAPLIAELISELNRQDIHVKSVRLFGNRIHGLNEKVRASVDRAVKQLLRMTDNVDISMNPIASVDRADFFAFLSAEELHELIWIPKHWVAAANWRILLRNSQVADCVNIVLQAHRKYYD